MQVDEIQFTRGFKMTKRFSNGMSVEDTLDTLARAQELAEELYLVLTAVSNIGSVRNYLLPAVADLVEGEGANPHNASIPKAMAEVKDDAEYLDEGNEGYAGEEDEGEE